MRCSTGIRATSCLLGKRGKIHRFSDRRIFESLKQSRLLSTGPLITVTRRTCQWSFEKGHQIRALSEKASSSEDVNETSSTSSIPHHDDLHRDILTSSLKHVPEMGWTDVAIAQGIADLNLPPMTVGIIERGSVELLKHFLTQKRSNVRDIMTVSSSSRSSSDSNESNSHTNDVREDPLYTAISAHIDFIKPLIKTWPSAMALLADPRHLDITGGLALDIVNDLCDYLGIQGSRLDWYSERTLLLMVYTSTELFMLTDQSDDLSDTKAYLSRCIETYRGARSSRGSFQMIQTVVQGAVGQFLFTQNPFSNRK